MTAFAVPKLIYGSEPIGLSTIGFLLKIISFPVDVPVDISISFIENVLA